MMSGADEHELLSNFMFRPSSGNGVEEDPSDEPIRQEEWFDPSQLNIATQTISIGWLIHRFEGGGLHLDPTFQRKARIWQPVQRSQFIESLLLRIPLPIIYVAATEYGQWQVVDGVQRITTVIDFVRGSFFLSGLEYLGSLEFQHYADLHDSLKRRILDTELVAHVILYGTPHALTMNIFKRINTGGTTLNGQEIRSALNAGPSRDFLRDLAGSPEFAHAVDGSVTDERMVAQELVLRHMAIRLLGIDEFARRGLDASLNEAMQILNSLRGEHLHALATQFLRALVICRQIFGNEAFRRPRAIGFSRNQINKALFEVWTVALAERPEFVLQSLSAKADLIKQAFFSHAIHHEEFKASIVASTMSPSKIYKRFEVVRSLINEFI
jgi:hypothetical protein